MRLFFAGIFCLAAVVGGGGISANAEVIASCGPMAGYSYHFQNDLADNDSEWVRDSLNTTTIFLGTDKVEEVVLKSKLGGEDWTRSTKDYGATVIEVNREGPVRHILIHWGPVTELYAIDTEDKTLSLVSQKSRPFKLTLAFVGRCE